jgi:CheY-like chemotaxis protein
MATAAHPAKRVLLVDDNFVTRETMNLILAGAGYQVVTAANGQDALERLRAHESPNLILLDLDMPVMDGMTFCQRRKQDGRLAAIPLVLVSSADDLAEKASSVGADSYLQKPVDSIQLLDVLQRCCGAIHAAADHGAPGQGTSPPAGQGRPQGSTSS